MPAPARIEVIETSQVGEARRTAAALSSSLGFDETARGKIAVVVSEAATNLIRHGGGGQILLTPVQCAGALGLEVLALDKGPGMEDIGRSMQDGFSTAGTAGNGLGAMSRMSDEFQIHSLSGAGTAVMSRFWTRAVPALPGERRLSIGTVCLPKSGEVVCGDAWTVERRSNGDTCFVIVDGLGHGQYAFEAASVAIRTLESAFGSDDTPVDLLERLHVALRSTRGAAASVALVSPSHGTVRFAGIGNVSGVVLGGTARRSMVSMNGTLGGNTPRIRDFEYPWESGAVLVLCSDGIASRWDLDRQPGLLQRDPALVAGVLFRDFNRGTDDATVLVAKAQAAS